MVVATCAGCGVEFESKSTRAKWCSSKCRQRAARARKETPVEPSSAAEPPAAAAEDHGLVGSVRQELEEAGAVDTFSGQLALQLARRLSNPDESGISSLSKELRTVMAAALDGHTPPAAEAGDEPVEEEDEVAKARRLREEARQAAGLA